MTRLSWILGFFPLLVVGLVIATVVSVVITANPLILLVLPVILYGLPLAGYRIHQLFYPLPEGITYLVGSTYSPWWGSYQFQLIYITFPALEALLRLIPGAFSLWLRLWGSEIGRGVFWTPAIKISDRGLLKIGDQVVFGYDVGLLGHVIKPKRANLMLYLKTIEIGDQVFVGAGSHLGPGVKIAAGSYLPIETKVHPNQRYPDSCSSVTPLVTEPDNIEAAITSY